MSLLIIFRAVQDQKKNFTGTEKKLPGPRPGPNKKSYRDRDQKKLVPHISSPDTAYRASFSAFLPSRLVLSRISPDSGFDSV
jgi:hypothetical protein